MKKVLFPILVVALVVSLGLVTAVPAAATTTSSNLLTNPGAELGMTGWTYSTGVASKATQPESTGTVLPYAGDYFFSLHDSSSPASMSQTVDLTTLVGTPVSFTASVYVQAELWWSGSPSPVSEDYDDGKLIVEFFDSTPESLGQFTLDSVEHPVLGSSMEGKDYAQFSLSDDVPSGAESAVYTLEGYLKQGSKINVFYDDLSFTVDLEANIDKAVSSNDGYLGDHITVTLTVENPYSSAIKVEDVIPDGLKYIPPTSGGYFKVDGSDVTPTIVGNTISTTVANGTHTITFNVQVVEVQCEEVDVTNTAELWYDGDPVASDSEDITLHPYEGFEKDVLLVYEETVNGVIEVNELVAWNMTITLPNNFAWNITGAILSDNLGGELGLAGDEVDNDRDSPKKIDEGDWGDLAGSWNTIPDGTLAIRTPGKSNKVHLKITGINVTAGDSLDFVLGIFTDRNPSKWGQQCYTSPCLHYLNSGATLKFTDPGTGFQLSAHTCPLPVYVTDAMLTLENKDSEWQIIEDDIGGELYYSTGGDVFCYEFRGYVPENIEYSLIYYADFEDRYNVWGGNNPGALIATGTASGGSLTMSGSIDLGMDLPSPPDANIAIHDYSGSPDNYAHAHGAKIWLVPSDCYNGVDTVTSWQPTRFLFETDLISYDDTDVP